MTVGKLFQFIGPDTLKVFLPRALFAKRTFQLACQVWIKEIMVGCNVTVKWNLIEELFFFQALKNQMNKN